MKQFLKYTGEYLRSYIHIKLTRTEELLIREAVMQHLGLSNLNQLRDRFEGQAFYEKTIKNIGSLLALQKYLNIELIDLDKANLSTFQSYIKYNGKKILVHVFDFGTLPLIKINEIKNSTFFIIQKDNLTFVLCGLASKEVIKKNLAKASKVKSSADKYMDFTGFKFLEQIK